MKNKLKALFTLDALANFWWDVLLVILWAVIVLWAAVSVLVGVNIVINVLVAIVGILFLNIDVRSATRYWLDLEVPDERV